DRASFVADITLLEEVADESLGGRVRTYLFDTPGEYGCHFWIPAENSRGFWGCGPIRIVEASSD
ncbi:MAG: hypothetical protein PVH41_14860, partial [Anaerolineae bacterium]